MINILDNQKIIGKNIGNEAKIYILRHLISNIMVVNQNERTGIIHEVKGHFVKVIFDRLIASCVRKHILAYFNVSMINKGFFEDFHLN